MSRVYSAFVLLLSAVLLVIFHGTGLTRFWNTEVSATGSSIHETFWRKIRPPSSELAQLNGRRLSVDNQHVLYQFAVPQQAEVYIRPTLVKQNELQDAHQKSVSYLNLKNLRLRLPQFHQQRLLFTTSGHLSQRIRLTPFLQNAAIFQLELDNRGATANSERVIGSLEINVVSEPVDDALPKLPLLMLFWILPLIWSWMCNRVLRISLASSLALGLSASLGTHLLWLFNSELCDTLLPASLVACLTLLGLNIWLEGQETPTAPYFWGLLWLGVQLRWQEILIQATLPLEHLPASQDYYHHALAMDLFSSKGFFAALYPQGPLYPFLVKLAGFVFGFSPLHMFYISLAGGLLLLILAYRLAALLLSSRLQALLVMALLVINSQLIRESGLRSPDIVSACLGLMLLLLVFSPIRNAWLRGGLRGILLMLLIWNHLSFMPLALVLLALDAVYQVRRSQATSRVGQSLRAAMLSLVIVMTGFWPCLLQNEKIYGSFLPESTAYVSHAANLEFADRQGFPASVDVIQRGEAAPGYHRLSIREYFFDYHRPGELIGGSLLGFTMLALDSIGSLFNFSTGENVLSVMIDNLASQSHLLMTLSLFLSEIFVLLFLVTFAWIRFRRYRFLLLVLALLMVPHAFFYGIFMLKGDSMLQSLLDQQVFLFSLPVLATMLVDALVWLRSHRQRWLR